MNNKAVEGKDPSKWEAELREEEFRQELSTLKTEGIQLCCWTITFIFGLVLLSWLQGR